MREQPEKRLTLWLWWRRVSFSRRSPQTGRCGARAVVPPPSGSVSASFRSAFLFSFSSSPVAGARVPTDSSSSSLLCLLPSGRPPASSQTKTQTQKSQRGSHFRRRAPALAATSLHVGNYAPSSLPVVASPPVPSAPPPPLKALPVAAGRGAGRGVSCDPPNSTASLPPGACGPALAGAIVIGAAVLGSQPPGAGEAPVLPGCRGTPGEPGFVVLSDEVSSVNISSQSPLSYRATPQPWPPSRGAFLRGPLYVPGNGRVDKGITYRAKRFTEVIRSRLHRCLSITVPGSQESCLWN
ncbi:uncharacterized protein RBU33_029577 [Hipposideros larvatus]